MNDQKLIDIMFQIGLTINSSQDYFFGKSQEEVAEWIADQLRVFGFNTKPCGASWGVLVDD